MSTRHRSGKWMRIRTENRDTDQCVLTHQGRDSICLRIRFSEMNGVNTEEGVKCPCLSPRFEVAFSIRKRKDYQESGSSMGRERVCNNYF